MRYLIVQDWDNTHGNHAGMVHMCTLLCDRFPEKYRLYIKPAPTPKNYERQGLVKKIYGYIISLFEQKKFARDYIKLCKPMFKELKEGDSVFLLEYHLPSVGQHKLAAYIRKYYPFVKIYGLSHLTPYSISKMNKYMRKTDILKWSSYLTKQLTLGSSLTSYFCSLGMPSEHISTGFHYVDLAYYNNKDVTVHSPISVISIGAQARNFNLLAGIVRATPDIQWYICKGRKQVDYLFEGLHNVKLVGYVSEDELKELMANSDISVNVMEDTVGSNVITTSMAMGLGMIVSDVGSIHDYCDDTNAVFCDNSLSSFVESLKRMEKNHMVVQAMKESSIKASSSFSIENVDKWFSQL